MYTTDQTNKYILKQTSTCILNDTHSFNNKVDVNFRSHDAFLE